MKGRNKTQKEFIPKFKIKAQKEAELINRNPVISKIPNKSYVPGNYQKQEIERPRTFLYCLENKGVPYFETNEKKLVYLKKKLYNSFDIPEEAHHLLENNEFEEKHGEEDLLVLSGDHFEGMFKSKFTKYETFDGEQKEKENESAQYTISKLKLKSQQKEHKKKFSSLTPWENYDSQQKIIE